MSNLSPPPYREKDITSQPWQKWFASLQALLAPVAAGAGIAWSVINKSGSNLTDLQFRSHTSLQDINTAGAFHLSETNHTKLTGNLSTDLHYHNSDRDLANASGILKVANGGTGGSTLLHEIELDFGVTATRSSSFTVTDTAVTAATLILMTTSGNAPTGRSADETAMESFTISCLPSVGSFLATINSLQGAVTGKYKFNYLRA